MSGYGELAWLVTFRPLSDDMKRALGGTQGLTGKDRPMSAFKAPWGSTVELLAREIHHLNPRQAIMELHLVEGQFRQDGLPRATARALSPAVVLTLIATAYGDLRYPCDTYNAWRNNVRALALALEALRKVDRYGVTKRGEQYAGWRQLTAGGPSHERGQRLVQTHGSIAAALRATHPDTSGYDSAGEFADVQAYRESAAR